MRRNKRQLRSHPIWSSKTVLRLALVACSEAEVSAPAEGSMPSQAYLEQRAERRKLPLVSCQYYEEDVSETSWSPGFRRGNGAAAESQNGTL